MFPSVGNPLEDLDPYRDLDDPLPPARLDLDEAEAWQRLFDEAAALLAAPGGDGPRPVRPPGDPGGGALGAYRHAAARPAHRAGVRLQRRLLRGHGDRPARRPARALAETLVHESQHSKLAALLHLFPLLDDDREERYYAPWRPDPRHLTGLLHGAYAFAGVAGFWRDRLAGAARDAPCPRAAGTAGYHFALRRLQSRLVVRTLLLEGRLTPQGRALVSGLARHPGRLAAGGGTAGRAGPCPYRRRPAPHRVAAAQRRARCRSSRPAGTPCFRPRPHLLAGPAHPCLRDPPRRTAHRGRAPRRRATRPSRSRRSAPCWPTAPAEPHALAGWIVARDDPRTGPGRPPDAGPAGGTAGALAPGVSGLAPLVVGATRTGRHGNGRGARQQALRWSGWGHGIPCRLRGRAAAPRHPAPARSRAQKAHAQQQGRPALRRRAVGAPGPRRARRVRRRAARPRRRRPPLRRPAHRGPGRPGGPIARPGPGLRREGVRTTRHRPPPGRLRDPARPRSWPRRWSAA